MNQRTRVLHKTQKDPIHYDEHVKSRMVIFFSFFMPPSCIIIFDMEDSDGPHRARKKGHLDNYSVHMTFY